MIPVLDRIDHIHVYVADRTASEHWYERVLALTRVTELEGWAEDGGPLTLANASGSVHIALFEREVQACRSTIAFAVTAQAFVDWQRHLFSALGEDAAVEDHTLSMSLYFSDPDGNPYEITTYEYAAVKPLIAAAAD